MKTVLAVIGGVFVFAALYVFFFGMSYLGIHTSGFLNKAQQEMNTKVFEETTSYTRGIQSEFQNMMMSYEMSSNPAVCATIRHKFGTYYDKLNEHQQFQYDRLPPCNQQPLEAN